MKKIPVILTFLLFYYFSHAQVIDAWYVETKKFENSIPTGQGIVVLEKYDPTGRLTMEFRASKDTIIVFLYDYDPNLKMITNKLILVRDQRKKTLFYVLGKYTEEQFHDLFQKTLDRFDGK